MQTVRVHRSLHRPDLMLGAEADLVFMAGLVSFLVALSSLSLLNFIAAAIFWIGSLFVFRQMAKKDPILFQVFRKHINQKPFYSAKPTPWGNQKSMSYKSLREKSNGFAELLQYAAIVAPGVMLLKNGSFMAGWTLKSIDAASSTQDELCALTAQVNNAVKLLGDGWMIQVDAVRIAADSYPHSGASHFPDPVSLQIEKERRAHFKAEGRHYSTENILYVTYKPNLTAEKLSKFAYAEQTEDQASEHPAQKALQSFQIHLEELEDALGVYLRLERLLEYSDEDIEGHAHTYSPLLSNIQHALTGEKHPLILPDVPMYLDAIVGGQDLVGGYTPKIGDKHIAVVAIDGFPQASWPLMLNILDGLPLPYRFNSRLICMDQLTATNEIVKYRKNWSQKMFSVFDKLLNKANPRMNRDAANMAEDAEQAHSDVQSGLAGAGYYSANIVLMDTDSERVSDWSRELRRSLQAKGFGSRIEDVNCVEAWLGTHPGNAYSNLRQVLLNTMNFSHLLPLSTIWAGRETNPCAFYPQNSPPLFYASTSGSTPFRMNLHVSDLGHTLIFGPTGAGKSTLLGLIAAQFRRYHNSNVFVFDKGLSMFPLANAVGGTHYEIAGESSKLAFCPLQHMDSDSEQSWAAEWIASLAELQGATILPNHRTAIFDALTQVRNSPESMRSLSTFYHYLQDTNVKEAIKHYTRSGAMGALLDATEDSLGLSDFTVFEIEELLNLGEKNSLPVLLYLFHRIEKSFKGQPSLLILDEAWIMLGHAVFREKIREWLKVLRKANCAVVLSTQSLSDAKKSGIMDVLSESCPTKIFLPNLAARQDTQADLYFSLGLNSKQLEIIASAIPKREYYVVSPEGCRLINLALGPVALSFVGASGKEDILRVRELMNNYGELWPSKLLEERGIF